MATLFTMNYYIGYFGSALIVVPVGALIAKYLVVWLAHFNPNYVRALVSTVVAYIAVNMLGFLLYVSGSSRGTRGAQLLTGWGLLSCSHVFMLRSQTGDRLTLAKASLIAFCQILGAIVAFIVILWAVLQIKRMVT